MRFDSCVRGALAACARAFVGRDSELQLLRATYRRAASNAEPHLVTIVGEPGVGLLRGNRGEVERWLELDVIRMVVYGPGVTAARLDALAALRDAAEVEAVAPAYALHGLALEPFAVRALGIVRDDDELLAQADESFAALGLDRHRAQTERLLAGPS